MLDASCGLRTAISAKTALGLIADFILKKGISACFVIKRQYFCYFPQKILYYWTDGGIIRLSLVCLLKAELRGDMQFVTHSFREILRAGIGAL